MQVVTLKKFGGGLIYSSNFDGVGATAKLGKKGYIKWCIWLYDSRPFC